MPAAKITEPAFFVVSAEKVRHVSAGFLQSSFCQKL
jgi:hypothetical protein